MRAVEQRQHSRGQYHAHGIEQQRGNFAQGIFDLDEGRAPNQGDEDQQNVGLDGAGHALAGLVHGLAANNGAQDFGLEDFCGRNFGEVAIEDHEIS